MSTSGPVEGWGSDAASAPDDPAKRTVFGRLSEAWELYRGHARPLLAIALLFQGILGLPLAVASYTVIVQTLDLFTGETNWFDPAAIEGMLAAGPFNDLALDYAFLGATIGLSFLAYALSLAATTSMLLAEPSDRWAVGPALRATFTNGLGLIVAGLVAMLAVGTVYWLQGVGLSRQLSFDPLDPGVLEAAGRSVGLSFLILALEIVAVYFFVRWVAAIGALVVEARTFQASLARSSELTQGRRRWIAGHVFAASLVGALVLLMLDYIPALAVGAIAGFGSTVFAIVLAVLVVGTPIVVVPFALVFLAALFRDLRDAGPKARTAPDDAPPGWGRGG